VFLFSYLLVCELPMFSLKFKNLKWEDNRIRFILIISSVVLAAVFQMAAIPLIIILFILMSIYTAFVKK
ncbi:MAG: CDP-diacylglycerol--serine O-phosphatidyltransferase, partial [Paludibacteraceae bacterium]|nr:CDP-diacylglycerol--serine O-phosphatidyltransferase [Paludibacteraceae bacterium]